MFLYEAVEYLFDEMHSSNNYQFRNYLNLNIDNHFHNMLYATTNHNVHHYYNNQAVSAAAVYTYNHQPSLAASSSVNNHNHVSLTLLPNLQANHQASQRQSKQQQPHSIQVLKNPTSTLPAQFTSKFNLPIVQQQQPPPPMRINEIIGNRLHHTGSFSQDHMTTIPLTSAAARISMDPQQQAHNKTSFIDLPRNMLPSFFDSKPQQTRR